MDGEHLALALIGQTESLIPDLLERIGEPGVGKTAKLGDKIKVTTDKDAFIFKSKP